MDIFKIAASTHTDNGDGWCECGEAVTGCWFQMIYFPYVQLCRQAALEAAFS